MSPPLSSSIIMPSSSTIGRLSSRARSPGGMVSCSLWEIPGEREQLVSPRRGISQRFFATKRAILGLGSNLEGPRGGRVANLEYALQALRRRGVKIENTSSLYETAAVPKYGGSSSSSSTTSWPGGTRTTTTTWPPSSTTKSSSTTQKQPRYLNACCAVRTDLEPRQLLKVLKEVELHELGRADVMAPSSSPVDVRSVNNVDPIYNPSPPPATVGCGSPVFRRRGRGGRGRLRFAGSASPDAAAGFRHDEKRMLGSAFHPSTRGI